MYRAFNLPIDNIEVDNVTVLSGKLLYENQQRAISENISKYISLNGILDGTMMQENWFPSVEADIFISHAHADKEDAIKLAGWLTDNFNLNVFIDSCIWGNSNDLLRMIDEEFCINDNKETFDYERRNYSTSHVHMMLSVALAKMIDKTECLFFLNTPKSVTTSEVIKRTSSPWIYAEIAMAQMLQKPLEFHRDTLTKAKLESDRSFSKGLEVSYELKLDEFHTLDIKGLNKWQESFNQSKRASTNALDSLYLLHPPAKSASNDSLFYG